MSRHFQPNRIAIALAGFIVGVSMNLVANFFTASPPMVQIALLVLAVLAALALWTLRPTVTVRFGLQLPLHPSDYPRYARRGLIVLAPALSHPKLPHDRRKSSEEYLAAARERRYQDLDFDQSTYETIICAAMIHRTRLEHCWLIATSGEGGSEVYVPALIDYLQKEKGLENCEFHTETADVTDDEALLSKVRDQVNEVFKTAARKYNLGPADIIADFTNGLRSMAAGVLLSCLDGRRDVQFIGSHYTDGRPTGELKPMLFRFEVQLIEPSDLP